MAKKKNNTKNTNNRVQVRQMSTKQVANEVAKQLAKTTLNGYNPNQSWLGNLGMAAGNGVSKFFGLGAYTLQKNSLWDSKTGSQVPFMHSTDESIVFRHREYISEITSSSAFTAYTYDVNPGNSGLFPYLSTIASAFQQYRFRGLVFEFKSSGATALVSGTNTAMGVVMMAARYRADAPAFQSKQELLNDMWSASCRTSEDMLLPIECDPKENPISIQYVRGNTFTGDQKMFDLAKLVVATQGSQASNIVGELWVSYEVEFRKPQVAPTGGVLATYKAYRSEPSGTGNIFGTVGISVQPLSLDVTITATTITFPATCRGKYLGVIYMGGTAAACVGPTLGITNGTVLSSWANGAVNRAIAPSNAVSSGEFMYSLIVSIPDVNAPTVVTFTGGTYPSNRNIDIVITELDDNTV